MNSEEVGRLEVRLATLEQRSKRLTRVCMSLGTILAVVVLAGAQVVNDSLVVREQLIIRDRANTIRIDMGVEKTNGLGNGLVLYDKGGKRRIVLGVSDTGVASLGFYKPNGDQIAQYP